jgi:hypothetical protein
VIGWIWLPFDRWKRIDLRHSGVLIVLMVLVPTQFFIFRTHSSGTCLHDVEGVTKSYCVGSREIRVLHMPRNEDHPTFPLRKSRDASDEILTRVLRSGALVFGSLGGLQPGGKVARWKIR